MTKKTELIVLVLTDFVAFQVSWALFFFLRVKSGLFGVSAAPDYWLPAITIWVYWFLVFGFIGLYRSWRAKSRLDEFTSVFKATMVGVLVLFFLIFLDDSYAGARVDSRLFIGVYWSFVLLLVGGGRVLVRTVHRRFLLHGIGLHNAVIIGWDTKGRDLYKLISEHPALGYRIVGFVKVGKRSGGKGPHGVPLLGDVDNLPSIIEEMDINDILIALESSDHHKLLDIIARCNGHDVSMKILPDMYDIVSGQARTNQIYGFPLIDIMPQIIQPWEESMKRLMDVFVSLFVLVISSPLWVVIAIAIKMDTPGPVVYSQERVGKDGKIFRMYKFRTMRSDAEKETGPVWAPVNDTRVTKVGRFLRNTRLDEIPQFINVLDGDMSLVGPRPERPYFVEKLSKEIPLYHRRLKVRPGITGWAQIKQGYDRSIDDVRSKVRYDLFYIENMSFRMDIKILLFTFYIMITGRGH